MPTQQIVAPPARAAMFLVLTVNEGSEDEVRDFLTDVPGLTRTVSFRATGPSPSKDILTVVGLGAEMWDRLFDAERPRHLHTFDPIYGDKHTAPSTPGDLLIHLRAPQMDLCFELARIMTNKLAGHASVVDEVHGFTYFDNRDLLGFVDGTENPEGNDADEAVHDNEDAELYNGGSYVFVQKYTHDLQSWNAISTEEQERVIGRTKLDDVELDDDVKPTNSHVALNDVSDEDGNDLDIFRTNMPFGTFGSDEFGTYFVGYAADPSITEQMLDNMFLGDPVGNYDRILDFSTAITGTLFYVPSVGLLEEIDTLPPARTPGEQPEDNSDEPASADTEAAAVDASDGSLGIGSLK
ncbi:MAG TPA: Dyp-type peroxidase [Dietzia timorensis]|uniref:Dyp-type peroxidase n=1 Tax=Dietzia timorensis TaxID=499555 RepID=A0A921F4G0_9ACTN|nr:Dyp-type peroxidase [Dietzia timorensis]HJE91072.1 Dyp-type peroxidase [Dietzia timorensis]